MCICAVLLPDLLFFPLNAWQSLSSFFPEGAEEQEDTEQWWMRVNSYSLEVWAKVNSEECVEQLDFGGSCLEGDFL